jgi:hypothetical protein
MNETPREGWEGESLPPGSRFGEEPGRERATLAPMPEPPAVSQEDLRKLLVIKAVRMRLLKIAYNRTHSVRDAKDLVSEVTVILLSGASPWRPDPNRAVGDQIGPFIVHVALLMRRCHGNRVTSLEAERTTEYHDDLADTVADEGMNVEEAAIDLAYEQERERRGAAWTKALCARMAHDGDALEVIEQHRLGRDDTDEQATALRWKPARVVLAKRRIAYHAPIVMAEQLEMERRADEERISAAKAAMKERVQP